MSTRQSRRRKRDEVEAKLDSVKQKLLHEAQEQQGDSTNAMREALGFYDQQIKPHIVWIQEIVDSARDDFAKNRRASESGGETLLPKTPSQKKTTRNQLRRLREKVESSGPVNLRSTEKVPKAKSPVKSEKQTEKPADTGAACADKDPKVSSNRPVPKRSSARPVGKARASKIPNDNLAEKASVCSTAEEKERPKTKKRANKDSGNCSLKPTLSNKEPVEKEAKRAKKESAAEQPNDAGPSDASPQTQQPPVAIPQQTPKRATFQVPKAVAVEKDAREDSYAMTPLRPKKPSTAENYDITDLNSGDETDEEDNPRKKIPEWAQGRQLKTSLISQHYNGFDAEDIFGRIHSPNLQHMFSIQRSRFKKRTSSANWDSPLLLAYNS